MLYTVPHNRIVIERTYNGWLVQEIWDKKETNGEVKESLVNQYVFGPDDLGSLIKLVSIKLERDRPISGTVV